MPDAYSTFFDCAAEFVQRQRLAVPQFTMQSINGDVAGAHNVRWRCTCLLPSYNKSFPEPGERETASFAKQKVDMDPAICLKILMTALFGSIIGSKAIRRDESHDLSSIRGRYAADLGNFKSSRSIFSGWAFKYAW